MWQLDLKTFGQSFRRGKEGKRLNGKNVQKMYHIKSGLEDECLQSIINISQCQIFSDMLSCESYPQQQQQQQQKQLRQLYLVFSTLN